MKRGDAPFKGNSAVITGGSSGIGKAVASRLAQSGANIFILARNRDRLDRALREIEVQALDPQQRLAAFSTDVTSYDAVEATIAAIVEAEGPLDVLINSAGIVHPGYVEALPLSTFRHQMDVNYFGTLHAVRAALPYMLERGRGHIVNISSMGGIVGAFGYTAYAASKFAVYGFTEALRAEMKPRGIGVSLAIPPDTDTPQLLGEREHQPLELKMINGTVKPKEFKRPSERIAYWLTRWLLTDNGEPMSPDRVAAAIVRGMRRGDYVIFPDATLKLAYHLRGFVIPLGNWAQDQLAAVARREREAHYSGPQSAGQSRESTSR